MNINKFTDIKYINLGEEIIVFNFNKGKGMKITDCRKNDEIRLSDVEFGNFFFYKDILYRKVDGLLECIKFKDSNLLSVWEVSKGRIDCLDRNTFVLPIRNDQIELIIND